MSLPCPHPTVASGDPDQNPKSFFGTGPVRSVPAVSDQHFLPAPQPLLLSFTPVQPHQPPRLSLGHPVTLPSQDSRIRTVLLSPAWPFSFPILTSLLPQVLPGLRRSLPTLSKLEAPHSLTLLPPPSVYTPTVCHRLISLSVCPFMYLQFVCYSRANVSSVMTGVLVSHCISHV